MKTAGPGGRGWLFRALALLCALAVALAGSEILLRTVDLGPISRIPAPNHVDPELRLHQIDPDPVIGWTLRPGARGVLGNVEVSVNSLGCRGEEPRPGAALVLSLGDSIAFGAGVREDALFTATLERHLRATGCDASVLACGVSGYNLLQTLGRYRRDLGSLAPRLILLSLFSDDLAPPYLMADRSTAAWLRPRSALFRALDFGWSWAVVGKGRWVPAWSRDPHEAREESLRELGVWADARRHEGVPVLALLHPTLEPAGPNPGGNTSPEVVLAAEHAAFPSVRLEDGYRAAVGNDLPKLSILPPARDPHPNAGGQALIAAQIETIAPELLQGICHPR